MKTVQARAHRHQPTHVHSHIMQEVAATDSCLAFIGVHQHEREKPMSQRPSSTAEASAKYSFKCQLHTTHVRAVGWESHGSPTTTCAGKADHGLVSFENSELNYSTA